MEFNEIIKINESVAGCVDGCLLLINNENRIKMGTMETLNAWLDNIESSRGSLEAVEGLWISKEF